MGLRLEGRHSIKYSETRGHWEESQLEALGGRPRAGWRRPQKPCRSQPGVPSVLQGSPGALAAQTVPMVVGTTEEKTLLWGPETKTASKPLSILKIIMSFAFPSMCFLVF